MSRQEQEAGAEGRWQQQCAVSLDIGHLSFSTREEIGFVEVLSPVGTQ